MATTLRAEAPSFLMPPPGLAPLCEDAWVSPVSTAAPSPLCGAASPAFSGCFSPWVAPFELGQPHLMHHPGDEDFGPLYLPESAFLDEEQALVFELAQPEFTLIDELELKCPEPEFMGTNSGFYFSDSDFKLTGMEDLENSVANLLANCSFSRQETSSTCCPGTEESSRPSTPEVDEVDWPAPPHAPDDALTGGAYVVWEAPEVVPRKGWAHEPATEACKEMELEETRQTSAIVQNVPKKCTRDHFAKTLDEAGFRGDYDFIYATADLKQRNCGSGSVLVNFRSEEACLKFTAAFHKTGVAVAFPGFVGKKAVEVEPALVQGLDANVRKLEKSGVLMSMLAERPGWRPARYNDSGQIEAEIGDC